MGLKPHSIGLNIWIKEPVAYEFIHRYQTPQKNHSREADNFYKHFSFFSLELTFNILSPSASE